MRGGNRTPQDQLDLTYDYTYDQLATLVSEEKLTPGARYKITDFATKHLMPNTSSIYEHTVEPLTITAISVNEFSEKAISSLVPLHEIKYDFTDNTCEDGTTARKGLILERYDPVDNVRTGYDFLGVRYRRWKIIDKVYNTGTKTNDTNVTVTVPSNVPSLTNRTRYEVRFVTMTHPSGQITLTLQYNNGTHVKPLYYYLNNDPVMPANHLSEASGTIIYNPLLDAFVFMSFLDLGKNCIDTYSSPVSSNYSSAGHGITFVVDSQDFEDVPTFNHATSIGVEIGANYDYKGTSNYYPNIVFRGQVKDTKIGSYSANTTFSVLSGHGVDGLRVNRFVRNLIVEASWNTVIVDSYVRETLAVHNGNSWSVNYYRINLLENCTVALVFRSNIQDIQTATVVFQSGTNYNQTSVLSESNVFVSGQNLGGSIPNNFYITAPVYRSLIGHFDSRTFNINKTLNNQTIYDKEGLNNILGNTRVDNLNIQNLIGSPTEPITIVGKDDNGNVVDPNISVEGSVTTFPGVIKHPDAIEDDESATLGQIANVVAGQIDQLTTDDIPEGANLYYTDARVQAFGDTRYVQKSGDTMTGSLLITAPARIDSVSTGGTDVFDLATQNADVINIGWNGATVNIMGTLLYQNVTDLAVSDKLVRYNVGGGVASATSSGFELEEDGVITGYFKTNGTRDGWLLKAPANSELEIDTAGLTASRNQSIQDFSGTIALVGVGLTDSRYATTSHALTHISGGSDQIDGEDLKVEVVPPTTNYTPTEDTLRGHLQGIDSTFGTLRTTTAGLLARVFFTGEEHVVDSVTYFRSQLGDFGTVANASPTPLSLTQADGETFFDQDLLSDPFADDLFVPAGAFSGTLTVRVDSSGHQETFRVEIYLADGTTGAVVDSGVSGAPVGDLGVPVITVFSTGVIELPNGVLTNASIDGTLLESINIPTGARVRTHISAEKLTSGGGSMTFEVFYGSDNRSQYDIPVAPTTDTVINRSSVTGQTSGEALEWLFNNRLSKLVDDSKLGNFTMTDGRIIAVDGVASNTSGHDFGSAGVLGFRVGRWNAGPVVTGQGTPQFHHGTYVLADLYFTTGQGGTLNARIHSDTGRIFHQPAVNTNESATLGQIQNGFVTLDTQQSITQSKTYTSSTQNKYNSGIDIASSFNTTTYGTFTYIDVSRGFNFRPSVGEAFTLRADALTTATRELTIPDASGTFVLDSNVQSISGTKTFTSASGVTVNDGDGSMLLIGAGLTLSRSTSYVRPDTNGIQNLNIGGPTAGSTDWNNINFRVTTDFEVNDNTIWHAGNVAEPQSGNGTANTLVKYTGTGTIGDSQITDDGTNVGINSNQPILILNDLSVGESSPHLVANSSSFYINFDTPSTIDNLFRIFSDGRILLGDNKWQVTSSGILQSNGAQTIQTSGTEALTLQGNGGLVDLVGGQLKFPSTQVPSADPNTLDDYEEGTFTPVVEGTSTSGVGTYTTQTGEYTKIGNRVFFEIRLGWSAHDGTGDIRIAGLPFNAGATMGGLSIYYDAFTVGSGKELGAFIDVSSSTISLRAMDPAGGNVANIALDTSVTSLSITGSYRI